MKVISASRREDMPAFGMDRLINAYKKYEAREPHFWVIWTKDPANLVQSGIDFSRTYLHLTVTGFGSTKIEPGVPEAHDALGSLESLIATGMRPQHINWRLDPIIPAFRSKVSIEDIAQRMQSMGVSRCTASFVSWYGHVVNRWPEGERAVSSQSKQKEIAVTFCVGLISISMGALSPTWRGLSSRRNASMASCLHL